MRTIALAIALTLVSGVASANCVGTDALRTCTDAYGNSYTTSRMGNYSVTNGYNARTGSTWNQNSYSVGNNTIINGQASNGQSWNATITPYGMYGTDSRGNSFYSPRW